MTDSVLVQRAALNEAASFVALPARLFLFFIFEVSFTKVYTTYNLWGLPTISSRC